MRAFEPLLDDPQWVRLRLRQPSPDGLWVAVPCEWVEMLAVHRDLTPWWNAQRQMYASTFGVTHGPSGMLIGHFQSRRAAMAAAQELASLPSLRKERPQDTPGVRIKVAAIARRHR